MKLRLWILAVLCGLALAGLLGGCNIILGLEPATLITSDAGTGATTTTTTTTTASTSSTSTATCADGGCTFGQPCKANTDCASCFCNGVTCDGLTLGTAQGAAGVAVDANSVYWTDTPSGIVAKAPIGGGGSSTTLAFGLTSPNAIALDAANVYWIQTGRVMSVPVNGGPTNTIAAGQVAVSSIALDPLNVYWNIVYANSGGAVLSAPKGGLDGGQAQFMATDQLAHFNGIAVSGTDVYITTAAAILTASTAPPWPNPTSTVATTDGGAAAIVVSGGNVYWAGLSAGEATIATAPTADDGGAATVLTSEASTAAPSGIVVDAAHVYWTDGPNGTVMKVPLSGGTVTTIASGQTSPAGIAVDATYVYWAAGTVVKKACK